MLSNMKTSAIETSKFIKTNRIKLGVTQAVFAEIIGKKRDDVASYEIGRAVPPGYVILKVIEYGKTKKNKNESMDRVS